MGGRNGAEYAFTFEKLKISQPAASLAVNRGKEIAKINHYYGF